VTEHLREEALWEALESEPEAGAAAHLAACADCRRRLDEAKEALDWARDASVPEPSPLFWEGFRRNVSRRIEQRERWAMAGRVAAVTALAASLLVAVRVGGPAPAPAETALPAWSALPAVEEDTGLELLRELDGLSADLPLVATSDVAAAVIELDEERGALLADAVKREFANPGEEDL
jgi:predicted anti-sigma-YlaC factor YlaD